MFSRIRGWLRERDEQRRHSAHRELVLKALFTALFPLERPLVQQMIGGLDAFSDLIRDDCKAGASPERTALTILTVVLPSQFASVAPKDRQERILAAVEEGATGPWQSVVHVLVSPSGDPLVDVCRNLASRVRSWNIWGLVDEHDTVLLFHEIMGAMRGVPPEERAAQRFNAALFDMLSPNASPALRAALDRLGGDTAAPAPAPHDT